MAGERLSMRKIRELLRLKARGHSTREIAQSLNVSHSSVRRYLERARRAGITWPVPGDLSDRELEARLFPPPLPSNVPRPMPNWSDVDRELGNPRQKGVTLQLLWLEYKESHPEGYQYSQFCEHYRRWKGTVDLELRHSYRAGEKLFVDYAGQTMPIVDPETGEVWEGQVFVGALGFSNYTYSEVTRSQELREWIGSHVRMFEYFGGSVEAVVQDNLKAGVKRACFYDPDLNPTYHELLLHYGTAGLPTRPGKASDKAKVESAVQNVERWVLAPLRKHAFFSLGEANAAVADRLEALNDRPFQKIEGSRRSLFEEVERAALRPLPRARYEYAQWKKAKVNIDYHVTVEGSHYSVPYRLVRETVEVRLAAATVEIFHEGRRVAAHLRSYRKGSYTTYPGHRPKSHRECLEWTPSRLIRWAQKTGPHTAAVVQHVLENRPHPEHGYRACLGILRLGDRYGGDRLEAACDRALRIRGITYQSVKSILQHGLDRTPAADHLPLQLPRDHAHLRGPDYYLH